MAQRESTASAPSPSGEATTLALRAHAAPPSYPLTARIAAGDEQAFAAFYDLWFERLFALARTSTRRDEAFCLDAVQDCMLKVVRKLPALASEEAVAAWLLRALLRAAVDRTRSETRRQRHERAHADAQPQSCADALPELLDGEQRAWLAARLAELAPADRALLEARAQGATLEASGRSAGITGHAAHGRIRRLVARLRDAARDWFGD